MPCINKKYIGMEFFQRTVDLLQKFTYYLPITMLEPKVIGFCHQCRVMPACISILSDLALYCLLDIPKNNNGLMQKWKLDKSIQVIQSPSLSSAIVYLKQIISYSTDMSVSNCIFIPFRGA